MTDLLLAELMDNTMPRMNKDICSGLATIQMKEVEDYLDQVMRGAAMSAPSELKYIELKRCTPEEEFREITRALKPNRSFDLSRSDVYMCKFIFKFNGVEIRPRYSLLPFVGDGGIIYLRGTQYKVTPVLGGRVFNIDKNVVYMTTPKSPIAFERINIMFSLDGKMTVGDAVVSKLYNTAKVNRPSKISSMLMHYILAEYGLAVTMKKFFDVDVRVGGPELDELIESSEWKVFGSLKMPGLVKNMRQQTVCEVRIAIPIGQYGLHLNTIVGSVFYIMDQCCDSVVLEDLDDPGLWLMLLYRFIFKQPNIPSIENEKMVTHLDSVRHSLPALTKRLLVMEGVMCEDIFELFKYMQLHLHDMLIHNDSGNMYEMELTTVKHLAYHIVCSINTVMFNMARLTGDRVTEDNVNAIFNDLFHKDSIFTTAKHAELSSDDIASDCKLFGATCNILSQSKAATAGTTSKHTNSINDTSQLLHPSQVEVGTYLMMSKAEPTGRGKINCFVYMSSRHFISANPKLEGIIDRFRKLLNNGK